MDSTQKLLQCVAENAQTGLDACEQLLQRTNDADMRKELMTEIEQYRAFERDSEQMMFNLGAKPQPKSTVSRVGMWLGLQMNTLTDTSPDHLAEMIIQGATMGVIEMTRNLNTLADASAEAKGIGGNFVAAQEDTMDRLKPFLCI